MVATAPHSKRDESSVTLRAFRASFMKLEPAMQFKTFLRPRSLSSNKQMKESIKAIHDSWCVICKTGRGIWTVDNLDGVAHARR